MWAFNFFFYNRKLKRILYIGVKAVSKAAADESKVRTGRVVVAEWWRCSPVCQPFVLPPVSAAML